MTESSNCYLWDQYEQAGGTRAIRGQKEERVSLCKLRMEGKKMWGKSTKNFYSCVLEAMMQSPKAVTCKNSELVYAETCAETCMHLDPVVVMQAVCPATQISRYFQKCSYPTFPPAASSMHFRSTTPPLPGPFLSLPSSICRSSSISIQFLPLHFKLHLALLQLASTWPARKFSRRKFVAPTFSAGTLYVTPAVKPTSPPIPRKLQPSPPHNPGERSQATGLPDARDSTTG